METTAAALATAAATSATVTLTPASFYDDLTPYTGTVHEIPAHPAIYEIRPIGYGRVRRVMADDVAEVIFE